MGHPPQAGLNAADNHRHIFVDTADQIAVNHRGMIRPFVRLSARGVGIRGPVFPGDKVVIHQGIHVAAGNDKGKPWPPKNRYAFFLFPVRLGNNAHAVTVGLQYSADNGMSKGRVIHIGVTDHIDEIKLLYALCFHIFFRNR